MQKISTVKLLVKLQSTIYYAVCKFNIQFSKCSGFYRVSWGGVHVKKVVMSDKVQLEQIRVQDVSEPAAEALLHQPLQTLVENSQEYIKSNASI